MCAQKLDWGGKYKKFDIDNSGIVVLLSMKERGEKNDQLKCFVYNFFYNIYVNNNRELYFSCFYWKKYVKRTWQLVRALTSLVYSFATV